MNDLSELLVDVGTALTGILTWFTSALAAVETALTTSVLLQIMLGFVAVAVGFTIVKKVISVIKSFKAGR